MTNVDDLRLISECKNGDSRAFGQLVEKYQKPLFNAAFRIVNDRDMAKDVTQTVFIRAYEKIDTYDPKFKFFSWVYRMAVNEAINVLRRQKKTVTFDDLTIASEQNPEDQMQTAQVEQAVESAVSKLPINYRMVTVFYYFANLPYQEISFVLGIPEKTVKSRLYSARQILSKSLSEKELVGND